MNNALLSRARVYVLKSLDEAALRKLVNRALTEERGLGARQLSVGDDAFKMLMAAADGDGRRMLNLLENASDLAEDGGEIGVDLLQSLLGDSRRRFDKGRGLLRPDLGVAQVCAGLQSRCGVVLVCAYARRRLRSAVHRSSSGAHGQRGHRQRRSSRLEPVPGCLGCAGASGQPRGELAVAQAITYIACAPKSNAVYMGFKAAMREAAEHGSLEVPLHLRNAPTKLMKQLGYGEEYRYAHDEPDAYAAGEDYFPEQLEPRQYYQPVPRGLELKIGEKLRHLAELDRTSPRQRRKP